MAFRPTRYLIKGELDNTTLGKVVGWMKFAGLKKKVIFDLKGDFHRDIRGAKIRFTGEGANVNEEEAGRYMQGFWLIQKGNAGDITAGLPPHDYVKYCYIECYSEGNGRVVIELPIDKVEVIGRPIPWERSKPIDRQVQAENMNNFLAGIAKALSTRVSDD